MDECIVSPLVLHGTRFFPHVPPQRSYHNNAQQRSPRFHQAKVRCEDGLCPSRCCTLRGVRRSCLGPESRFFSLGVSHAWLRAPQACHMMPAVYVAALHYKDNIIHSNDPHGSLKIFIHISSSIHAECRVAPPPIWHKGAQAGFDLGFHVTSPPGRCQCF